MNLDQSEKRAAFVVACVLVAVNLAALLLSASFKVVDPLIGVLVIDLIFGGVAALHWVSHWIFPDKPQSTQPDDDATVEIKSPHIGRSK